VLDAVRFPEGVVYVFAETRGGRHSKAFLGNWTGKLVCDDYAGYEALFDAGVTGVGCMAHARRKLHELWASQMSLIQSAKLNGHDPYRYLKDVLEWLPTQPASRIDELLPHRWKATGSTR
jgi:hypothetical protein